jgi:thiol-disulfide isomerase/thioredoxin
MKKKFLLFVFFIFLANTVSAQETPDFPVLRVKTFDGKIFDLKDKKGKVVIVNFWAKWCVYCVKEMPILDGLYKKYPGKIEVIGISVDPKRSRAGVAKAAKKFSYPNSTIFEVEQISFEEPTVIPLSYVVDGSGKVRMIIQGNDEKISLSDFEIRIQPLLSE